MWETLFFSFLVICAIVGIIWCGLWGALGLFYLTDYIKFRIKQRKDKLDADIS